MKGFPGFINQQAAKPMPTVPQMPLVRTAPAAPSAPPNLPVAQRPSLTMPVVAASAPAVRPVTVATVTRNLQSVLGPAASSPAPIGQAFPGFVSRKFDQVQQYKPTASNAGHLNNLANLFTSPTALPVTPDRRTLTRPGKPARPAPAPKNNLPPPVARPTQPTRPAPQSAPNPAPAAQRPAPTSAAQRPAPTPAAQRPAPTPAAQRPAATVAPSVAAAPFKPSTPPIPVMQTPAVARAMPVIAKTNLPEIKNPPAQTPKAPVPMPLANTNSASEKATVVAEVTRNTSEKIHPAKATKSENQASPAAELKVTVEPGSSQQVMAAPLKPAQEPSVSKAADTKEPFKVSQDSRLVEPKASAARTEISDQKINSGLSEVQRQQLSPLRPAHERESLPLAEQAGLAGSSQFGQGQGGGQQGRQQQQHQQEEDSSEECEEVIDEGGCAASGGSAGGQLLRGAREEVQWWHLKGKPPCELKLEMDWLAGAESVIALSSELREANHALQQKPCSPIIPLGKVEESIKPARGRGNGEFSDSPPRRDDHQEATIPVPPQQTVTAEVACDLPEICLCCGAQLGDLDPRRCPDCLRANALETLKLLTHDGNYLEYRIFLTVCRVAVTSQGVYRLRDFASVPRGAYWVRPQLAA